MVILLQKFNGKNCYNNCIHINFKKKTVDFKPIKDISIIYIWYAFFMGLMVRYILIAVALAMLLEVIIFTPFEISVSGMYLIPISGFSILTSFITSLIFFSKDWRTNYYPKFNGSLRIGKSFYVNPESIINNVFVLPQFENIKLTYEVTEDFAKYIKDIKVTNIYKNYSADWLCAFVFKKTPNRGYMKFIYK